MLKNCRKPEGFMGRFVARSMNKNHARVSSWGLSHLNLNKNDTVLDIGCGGGANIESMLKLCPGGKVSGIDYSKESVAVSRKRNSAYKGSRCDIREGSVSCLPYKEKTFDVVTAFETVYFWPDIVVDFKEVYRVLKPGGIFFICNEDCDPDSKWQEIIEGMRVYSKNELISYLKDAGFNVESADEKNNKWVCVIARKEGHNE